MPPEQVRASSPGNGRNSAADAAAERLTRLQRVTSALSGSLTPAEVADVVVAQGVAALGARAGSVALVTPDGATLEIVRASGYPEEVLAPYRTFPLDAPLPVATAVHTGEPVYIRDRAEWGRLFPSIDRDPRSIEGDAAWAAVPLPGVGRTLGAIGLSFLQPRAFDPPEREFMVALAAQCAQALERARLFEDAQRARADAEASQRRFALLAEASAALAEPLGYQDTLAALARFVTPRLCDWCAMDMLAGGGQGIERVAVAHVDPEKVRWAHELHRRFPSSLDDPTGVGKVLRTGERDFFPLITDEFLVAAISDPERLAVAREIGFSSYLCVPLAARGRPLGALTFVTTRESGRCFSDADVLLCEELARRASVAVDNARLLEAAQESEERLGGIIGSAMDAILTVDADRRILVFNAAAERMFRCPAKDAVGTRVDRFLPDGRAARLPEEGERPGGPPTTPEIFTAVRADGERFSAEAAVSRAEAAGQALYTAIIRDVTERLRADAELRESEGRFSSLADAAPVLIWMSDAAGACTYFNRTWLEFTGRPLGQEIGDGWTEGVHEEDRERIRRHWREALVSREPFESEYRLRRRDGAYRWVLDIGSPRLLRDGTVVGWIGSVIDITERREAALALQEQEARQRAFLVDILASVTEGKFRLCGSAADLPAPLPPVSESIPLDKAAMRNLRNAAQAAAAALGMSEERAQDLLTAVGEAGMNAVRHGGGGTGRIRAADGVVQVWTEDRGKGIDLKNLPRAVAERGYTTGGGFGHGFFLMISSVDRVYLLTGPEGTTVVLEQGVEPPAPAWLTAKGTAADW